MMEELADAYIYAPPGFIELIKQFPRVIPTPEVVHQSKLYNTWTHTTVVGGGFCLLIF